MTHDRRSGPDVEWDRLVNGIHERNFRRAHSSPSVLLARRERAWRLHDRPGLTGYGGNASALGLED